MVYRRSATHLRVFEGGKKERNDEQIKEEDVEVAALTLRPFSCGSSPHFLSRRGGARESERSSLALS